VADHGEEGIVSRAFGEIFQREFLRHGGTLNGVDGVRSLLGSQALRCDHNAWVPLRGEEELVKEVSHFHA